MIGNLKRTSSESARLNEDISALISHEYQLVRESKEAAKLT